MRIKLIIPIPRQTPQREQIDRRGYRLPLLQGVFDFGFELARQGGGVGGEEFEDVVADEVGGGAVGDAEDVGDAEGVEVYDEGVVGYYEVLWMLLSAYMNEV